MHDIIVDSWTTAAAAACAEEEEQWTGSAGQGGPIRGNDDELVLPMELVAVDLRGV